MRDRYKLMAVINRRSAFPKVYVCIWTYLVIIYMCMYAYTETYINIILHKHTFLQKRYIYIYIYLYLPNTVCVFMHTHIQRAVKQNRDYARKRPGNGKKKSFITSCVGYQK